MTRSSRAPLKTIHPPPLRLSNGFPIFATVKVGLIRTADTAFAALEAARIKLNPCSRHIIAHLPYETEEAMVRLVRTPLEKIGLEYKDQPSYSTVCSSAITYGFHFSPAEVVVELLRRPEFASVRGLSIGMNPIGDCVHEPCVFTIQHIGGSRWLTTTRLHALNRTRHNSPYLLFAVKDTTG